MALAFYNTRTRRRETFEPLEEGKVSIYVCGVTVYDRCHVGHARSLIFFDAVVRYLRWRGYQVHFVRNVTDIDDKIIARAAADGIDWKDLAGRYTESMHADLEALGCVMPDIEPRATDHIDEMLELIGQLEAKGLAYKAGPGDVFFSVGEYKAYGKLSGRNIEDLLAGARVEVDPRKKNPMDFALWKASGEGEPSWPSPWGAGRPGWHLECSAMSTKYLGQPFDIHGGGEDLVFPHHENELAQSSGANDGEFVRYWMHHAFVRLDQEKMSKSLGNVFAIEDLLAEVEAEGLRLNLLSTHYRSPLDFSPVAIAESTKALVRAYETIARAEDAGLRAAEIGPDDERSRALTEAMDDDLNTARAVAVSFDAVRELNRALDAGQTDAATDALALLKASGRAVGLFMQPAAEFLARRRERQASSSGVDAQEIETLIAQRNDARTNRDFATADRIRDELASRGIALEDGAGGTTWTLER